MTLLPTAVGHLVGLAGYAGSGKDTAAATLLDSGWTRMAFADGVRDLALALDQWFEFERFTIEEPLELLVTKHGWDRVKQLAEVRRLLQNVGKGVRDVVGPDAWVAAMQRRWRGAGRPPTVITDIRYPNESAWVRSRGGLVIRIDRPGVGPLNEHESETLVEFVTVDTVVVNNGMPEQLQARVADLVGMHYRSSTGELPF